MRTLAEQEELRERWRADLVARLPWRIELRMGARWAIVSHAPSREIADSRAANFGARYRLEARVVPTEAP
jgi:hypothetical protein